MSSIPLFSYRIANIKYVVSHYRSIYCSDFFLQRRRKQLLNKEWMKNWALLCHRHALFISLVGRGAIPYSRYSKGKYFGHFLSLRTMVLPKLFWVVDHKWKKIFLRTFKIHGGHFRARFVLPLAMFSQILHTKYFNQKKLYGPI